MQSVQVVQVYLLVTEGTIEEKLLATLSAKHDLALAALDMESLVKTRSPGLRCFDRCQASVRSRPP